MAERLQPSQVVPVDGEAGAVSAPSRIDALVARSRTADSAAAVAAIDGLAAELRTLRPSREAADLLLRLLERDVLEGLVTGDGWTCRALAVETLLSFGFPYALEVDPEDLAHYRAQGHRVRWDAATVSAGLLVLAGVGFQLAVVRTTEHQSRVVVLSMLALLFTGLAVAMPVKRRRWPLIGLALSGVAMIVAGVLGSPVGLVAGAGSLVAALLMARRPAR